MVDIFQGWDGKAQFSGHETFPLRLLWLRKAYDAVGASAPVNVFKDDEAIIRFGVGRNMAVSMRYWAQASGIIEQDGKILVATEFGHFLFGKKGVDPYLEHLSSLWLIHWNLASTPEDCTTIYYGFNGVVPREFQPTDLVRDLSKLIEQNAWRGTEKTIRNDVNVFVRNYAARQSGGEDASEPLLAELSLLQETGSNHWLEFSVGPKPSLSNHVFAYALDRFWKTNHAARSTLTAEQICYAPGSPGRVFKLDEDSAVARMMALEETTNGALLWTDTAGLRQVQRAGDMDAKTILKAAFGPREQIERAA